jgi:hypothetical protein
MHQEGWQMSKFFRMGDVIEPKLVFTLPPERRPEKLMFHGLHFPLEGVTRSVCIVHPNGEVKMFPGRSRPNDVMAVLARDYQVSFEELEGISWG